ncbi:endonuclease/exonuclease/phosphatase family protein [Streptomyces sp. NPDC005012]|uniref:endonuclease/exonuclease/phosphatase family protein n=1 Tax=unclassified Streptomyces TaxID=2593676 RepID=UPI0033BCB320
MTRDGGRREASRRGGTALRTALAVAALLAAAFGARALLAPDAGPPAERPGPLLTVATWNMCGVRQWNCEATGDTAAKRKALEELTAGGDGARVLLLQEVCAADLEAVRARLGATWHAEFRAYTWRAASGRVTTVRCDGPGGGEAGYAVLSAYPLEAARVVRSPQPAVGVQRGLLCADVPAHDVQVCTAHLTVPGGDTAHPGREYRDDQLQALFAAQDGRRAVFGGDLNVAPPGARDPASWVWPAAARAYRECDRAASAAGGRPTHVSGHKLDHLFSGLPLAGCEVSDTGASDHRALLMTVRTGGD